MDHFPRPIPPKEGLGEGEEKRRRFSLTVPALAAEACCLGLAASPFLPQGKRLAAYVSLMTVMSAIWFIAWRRSQAETADLSPSVMLWSAVFFVSLVWTPPLFDNDLARYLWDGKVAVSGVNPYRYAPADPALAHLRDAGHAGIGYPELPTPYPPAAQFVFAGLRLFSNGDPRLARLGLLPFFLALLWLLRRLLDRLGRHRRHLILFAWHPAVLKELANSGHIEAAGLCLLLAAVVLILEQREAAAGVFFSGAVLIKFIPLLVLPLLLVHARRRRRFMAALTATAAVLYLPFIGAGWGTLGSLFTYLRWWLFNHGPFALLEALAGLAAGPASAAAARWTYWGLAGAAALAAAWAARGASAGRTVNLAGWLLLGVIAAGPAVMPWYLLWPLALLTPQASLAAPGFTLAAQASYIYYLNGQDVPWVRMAEYFVLAGLLAYDWRRRAGSLPPAGARS